MGIAVDRKYGSINLEGRETRAAEACFVLRGQDALAPVGIRAYAAAVRAVALTFDDQGDQERMLAHALECDLAASDMEARAAVDGTKLPD